MSISDELIEAVGKPPMSHGIHLDTAWDELSGPLRTWIHRPSDSEGKPALISAYRGLSDKEKASLQYELDQAIHKEHGSLRFTAYRRIKETDSDHATGGTSLSTIKPESGVTRVATYNVSSSDVMVHWAQGGPLKGNFQHEKELILKPGARLTPTKIEGGA